MDEFQPHLERASNVRSVSSRVTSQLAPKLKRDLHAARALGVKGGRFVASNAPVSELVKVLPSQRKVCGFDSRLALS